MTSPFAVFIMKKPIFVVLRKYFSSAKGFDTPFTSDGGDISLFDSFDDARDAALSWCSRWAKSVSVLRDCGELSDAACQCDNWVFQCVGTDCTYPLYVRVVADIFQKYVL